MSRSKLVGCPFVFLQAFCEGIIIPFQSKMVSRIERTRSTNQKEAALLPILISQVKFDQQENWHKKAFDALVAPKA